MKMFHVNKKGQMLQKSHDVSHIQDVVTNKPYFYKDLNYYIQNCHNNMDYGHQMNRSSSNEFLNVRKQV